jgi:hypothetical protein
VILKFGTSLQTSPSIRSEWKLRLEIFLSTCWRIYSHVEKFFYRRRKWVASDPVLTRLTAEAAESYLKYSGSLKVKHLEKAVERFWQAKNHQTVSGEHTDLGYLLYLEGYADKLSKRKLFEGVAQLLEGQEAKLSTEKTKFRPDVAYRVHGDYGLCAGLSLQIRSREASIIRGVANFLSELKDSNSLTVEKFHVIDSQTEDMTNVFLSNIIEYLPLLEAACDKELTNAICEKLEELNAAPQLYCTASELAKLYVIAGRPLPEILSMQGWRFFEVRDPSWQDLKNVDDVPFPKMQQVGKNSTDLTYIPISKPSMVVLQNVSVTSGDVLTSDQNLFNIDPAANPSFSFVAGHQGVVVGSPANLGSAAVLVPKSEGQFIPQGILLSSRADTNWFHWLIETLPKLLYLDSEVPSDVPVIISDRIPDTAKESLGLLSDRTIIEIEKSASTRVGKLYVSSPVLFHPDPVELHLNPVTNTINVDALNLMRQRILSRAKETLSEASGSQLIYFSRSSGARSLVNSRRVAATLRRLGYVVHDPGQMSFIEQVIAFHSAKRVVMVGGASMANLIFCSEGAAVITLRSEFTVGYKMPQILAGVSGARVISFSGRPVGNLFRSSFLEKVHAHYYVGIRALSSLVRQIL